MAPFVFLFLTAASNWFLQFAFCASAATTPLSKVIEMLDGMLVTCKNGKAAEEKEYAAKTQWCESTSASLEKSITEATAAIEQLEADIAKADADAEELGAAADDLLAEADGLQAEATNATTVREKEKSDYDATHADFTESIDAVERATAVLKSRSADIPQSLIQVHRSRFTPPEDRESIESLLAFSGGQAPKANAYEFQSSGAIDMLEKLRLKFQDERVALEKAELAARSNYEVLMQRLTDSIRAAKATAEKKTSLKAQRLEDAATAKGDLTVTQKGKAEDEQMLSDTSTQCAAATKEFNSNQAIRADEIKTIETTIGILSSDAVSGNAATYLPAALTQIHGTSFAQLRRAEVHAFPQPRATAAEFLQGRARELGSRFLSLAASRMTADPFVKVKKMLKDLIVKLMEQANAEADHNAFCTTELATNKQTREIKQAEVDELTAAVEKYTAEGEKLASEISELSDDMAEIKQQQSEAAALREKEKATNVKTMDDAKESQVAVEKAIQVMKDFYGKAEGSFLQDGSRFGDAMAEASKAPYKGMLAESGNILGFLEVILSDFARLGAETSSAEDESQESFDKYMDESTKDLAVKETELSHKKDGKMDSDAELASTKKELELTHEELDAALSTYEKLKPDCVDLGLSYEERVQKREAEIQSLTEALKMLSQQDLDGA